MLFVLTVLIVIEYVVVFLMPYQRQYQYDLLCRYHHSWRTPSQPNLDQMCSQASYEEKKTNHLTRFVNESSVYCSVFSSNITSYVEYLSQRVKVENCGIRTFVKYTRLSVENLFLKKKTRVL